MLVTIDVNVICVVFHGSLFYLLFHLVEIGQHGGHTLHKKFNGMNSDSILIDLETVRWVWKGAG